ncbi:hypothetical protein DL1_16585 [Thioclava dalianensis]|uniref:DNA primase/polymerase bifunctional N-terminal domain-containing protein n=1 Tax=Thioclava dalianensis TaxID=1185766 RepID=A0A074TCX7_9RHOB|nr:bifunctional DNA primase/polymerase [Thioclava dalianensis]KEP68025.1 hypothetical protein DL1_16585 [Thioclava dalianensis]SFN61532.1 Primase C terminal 1 (PriCT-1) [Thioclava dalianensis]
MSFARWQPHYAAAGVATFPVTPEKTPAVTNYLKIGLPASQLLAGRFGSSQALGFAPGPKSGLTILDVDTTDERILADALDRHGQTPVIVRSAQGRWHAYYKHNGERRRIRPDASVPVDILGGGYAVAPPSRVSLGQYGFVSGSLEDLPDLPVMRAANEPDKAPREAVGIGQRNDTLWRRCMAQARHCDDFEAMLDVAFTEAEAMFPPLPEGEVVKVARSAWSYTERGENWFGSGKRVASHFDEIDGLMMDAPDAYILLTYLRRHYGSFTTFTAPNDMGERFGWTPKRMARARGVLIAQGLIEELHPASSYHGAAVYGWAKGGQN